MRRPNAAYIFSLLLWGVSLFLPAMIVVNGPTFFGHEILIDGYQAARYGVVAWYANPLMLIACIAGLLRWYRSACLTAFFASGLAISSFFTMQIARSQDAPSAQFDFSIGFYLWIAASFVIFVTSIWQIRFTLLSDDLKESRQPYSRD